MSETKKTVRDVLDHLPDYCSLSDVMYHLLVITNIEQGLAEALAGQTVPHELVEEEMLRKWSCGSIDPGCP